VEKIEEVLQPILKAIEDDPCHYQLQLARWGLPMAIQNLSPKGVLPDTLVRGVLEVLCAHIKEALSGLWEVLGTPPPRQDLEDRLTKNGFSYAFSDKPLEGFSLHARPGLVSLDTASGLRIVNRRVFLRTANRKPLEKTLEGAKALRPLLATMGLSDLEDAIEALLGLGEGEGRAEGGYVLARSGGFWALWRGTFLGDPNLDVALLAEREAVLPSVEGVALSFKVRFMCSKLYVDRLNIGWEGGSRHIKGSGMLSESLFAQRSVVRLLQKELGEVLKGSKKSAQGLPYEEFPPKVLDGLRAFIRHGDFLG
jgi:hypothetical protein